MLLTPIDMYGIHLWDDMKVELMGGVDSRGCITIAL